VNTEKPIGTLLSETKEEFKEFLDTRLQLLKAEINEKMTRWKASVPLLAIAAAFLLSGWMVLTFAFVALLHALFLPSAYSWLWAGLIVAGIYFIGGIVLGWMGYSELTSVSVTPERTLKVLKQDQVWIQNETRAA